MAEEIDHENSNYLHELMQQVAQQTGKLTNIRHIGWMVAADLTLDMPRAGYKVFQQAVKLGALLRPLGNTIYWLPPMNIDRNTLDQLAEITTKGVKYSVDDS